MDFPRTQLGSNSTITPPPLIQSSDWDKNIFIIWTIRMFLLFGIPFLLHKIYQFYRTRLSPHSGSSASRKRFATSHPGIHTCRSSLTLPQGGRAESFVNTMTGLFDAILSQSSMSNLAIDFGPGNAIERGDLAISLDTPCEGANGIWMQANSTQQPVPMYDPSRYDWRRGLDASIER